MRRYISTFTEWFAVLLSGRPHFYIGGRERPYMLRWYLIPRNRWLNIYLHKFMRDDDDRALHDHPWWFASVMLIGSYTETRCFWRSACRYFRSMECSCGATDEKQVTRRAPSIAFRRATDRHRVTLHKDESGRPVPCWTLVITGPKVRTWGFWCPKGFVPWNEFVDANDPGAVGPGCGGST